MKRFHEEIAVMKRRIRDSKFYDFFEDRTKGFYRKRRPYDRCSPNQHCGCCEMERSWHKTKMKKARVQGKLDTKNEIEQFESRSLRDNKECGDNM